jgi:hypothetical protein
MSKQYGMHSSLSIRPRQRFNIVNVGPNRRLFRRATPLITGQPAPVVTKRLHLTGEIAILRAVLSFIDLIRRHLGIQREWEAG